MAPMDKYTRLVGGVAHGLCAVFIGVALVFFFSSPPLMNKPVHKGSGVSAAHPSYVAAAVGFTLKEIDAHPALGSLTRCYLLIPPCVRRESDRLRADASPVLHHLSDGKSG